VGILSVREGCLWCDLVMIEVQFGCGWCHLPLNFLCCFSQAMSIYVSAMHPINLVDDRTASLPMYMIDS
jgi:hypothetical protein